MVMHMPILVLAGSTFITNDTHQLPLQSVEIVHGHRYLNSFANCLRYISSKLHRSMKKVDAISVDGITVRMAKLLKMKLYLTKCIVLLKEVMNTSLLY